MQLVDRVEVRGLRSLGEVSVELGSLTSLVGVNGSGKSNVLRALNLFFNDELEAAVPVVLARDFHKPWRKVPKAIEIDVHFALPDSFSFRKGLAKNLRPLGIKTGAEFWLRRRWLPGPYPDTGAAEEIHVASNGQFQALSDEQARAVRQFLQLIKFRYVPNHVHPSALVADERAELQAALLRALRRRQRAATRDVDPDAVLKAVEEAASEFVAPVTGILERAPGHVKGLDVSTPDDWAQVAWSLAFEMSAEDIRPLDVELHGSGDQSFLAYALIWFLDTRFSDYFGWRQAAVWAIEEPESFLHANLKQELARFLAEISSEARFQAVITTHDLGLAAAAETHQEVSLERGSTTIRLRSVHEIAESAVSTGASDLRHPLHLTPPKPTLLLEGASDVEYVNLAYSLSDRRSPWDVRCMETVDPQSPGGKDAIRKYLRVNRAALRARPSHSPVVVVLDPDAATELTSITSSLDVHPTSVARTWPPDLANPELDETVKGIERYLSSDLYRVTAQANPGCGIVSDLGGSAAIGIQAQKSTSAKRSLLERARTRTNRSDLDPLIRLLDWLEQMLPSAETQLEIAPARDGDG